MQLRNSDGKEVFIRTSYSKILGCMMLVLYVNGRAEDKYILTDFTESDINEARETLIKRNNLIRDGNADDLINLFKLLAQDNKPIPFELYNYLETLKDDEVKNLHQKVTLLSITLKNLVNRIQ